MYNIVFSIGKNISLGSCVITASDDTTLAQYHTTDDVSRGTRESLYVAFTTLDVLVGEKVFISPGFVSKVLLGRISAIASGSITLTDNPGQIAYHEVLKKGFINPFINRIPDIYSYPMDKYCGMSLIKKGEEYRTFAEINPILSDSTLVSTNSIIAMYFEKGNRVEEISINVRPGEEMDAIKNINGVLKNKKDIDFSSDISTKYSSIIGINSLSSSNKTKGY